MNKNVLTSCVAVTYTAYIQSKVVKVIRLCDGKRDEANIGLRSQL